MGLIRAELKSAFLQALVINAEAIRFPGQNFYTAPPLIEENEHIPGKQVPVQFVGDNAASIEGLQHIDIPLVGKIPGAGMEAKHR